MNPTWPMVMGALFAGTVAGFMIPVRPEIRDVPALTASKATEPAKKSADGKTTTPVAAKTEDAAEVRQIPLTEPASRESVRSDQVDAGSCAKETWPHRSPNCLDHTATAATAAAVIPARRVEPKAAPQEKASDTTTAAAPKPEPVKPITAKPEPKVVSAPARDERAEPAAPAEQAAARSGDEPRAEAVNEQQEAKPAKPRRAARRVNREIVDFDDGIPTRIYLRGPDGRLYLAPEHRPSGQTFYFVR